MAASKAIGFLNFKFSADLTSFERGMKKAQKSLKKFGNNLKKTGKNLTTGLTLPLVGLGVASLKTFADFEQGMLKVKAISGATDSQFKALTESAKELGSTTMFTASQVAELQLNLSKLGFDPQSILDSSQAILNLAQATDSDLAQAATVAASTMNAFGLEAKDMTMISDVMADAFSSSALDLEKFQTAMASVAPVAKQAGQDIQGTSAILGVLVNNGIEASTAGTALRNIFLDLANQGLTWDEAMQQIQGSINPLQTAMDMFGKRGAAVATIIANNGTEIQKLTEDFNDSAGEAKGMADIMDSGVGGAFRKLQSQLEGAGIELGEKLVPIFTKFGEKVKELIKWFTELSPEQQENIVKWTAIVAALGPVLWIVGQLITTIGFLGKALMFLAANPVVLIIAVIVALGVAIYEVMTGTSKFAVTVRNAFATMVNGVIGIINKLIKAFNKVSEAVGGPTISEIKKLKKETYQAGESMAELADATGEAALKSKLLSEVTDEVTKSTKSELTQVAILNDILKDEGTAREDQIKALNELKEISPQYYGELKLGAGIIDDLTIATDNYTKSLLNQAKVEAVQTKIKEVYSRKIEAEIKLLALANEKEQGYDPMNRLMEFKAMGDTALFEELNPETYDNQLKLYTDMLDGMNLASITFSNKGQSKSGKSSKTTVKSPFEIDLEELEKNHQLALNQLKETQLIEQKSQEDFDAILESEEANHLNNKWDLYNQYQKDVTDLDSEILDHKLENTAKMFSAAEDQFEGIIYWQKQLTDAQLLLNAGVGLFGDILGSSLNSALDSQENFFQVFVENIKKAVRELLIQLAIMTMIDVLMGGKNLSKALLTGNAMKVMGLADGGIVSGPTTALIGEYPGASSNPEVVAPLDKLKSMIGGSQNVTVQGRLVGNDIYLSNERTNLNEYATSTIKSSNGTTYTATIWWTSTGAANTWTLGPSGAEINYESEKVDDKNSPILTSNLSFPVMVEDATQQNWINGIRTGYQEKDVWITIRIGTTGQYIWSGYVIMDLETREDVSFPYETTLTAIDGIATLKEIPFLRETNSSTSAVPTYPYVRADTWDNAGFQQIIGNSSSWLKILLDNVGQLLQSDDDAYDPLDPVAHPGELENYTIQTSFNWWNEEMTPAEGTDPLANMKLSMRPFYSQDENGYMDVPNCYDVLKDVCTNFGMRLIYWNNQFHFIQVNEYNTDEQESAPYNPPVNIPSREYFYTGGHRTDRDYLGRPQYSLYKMVFENATNPGAGLQKLTGTNYQALPAIKKTTGTYIENAGTNVFNGFPLFLTHNTGSITPTTWPTTGGYVDYQQNPNLNGIEQTMEISNAKDLQGFVCKVYCDFSNTSNRDIKMETLWTIRAKPKDSAWGDADNMTMYKHQAATYAEFRWMSAVGEYPLSNNQQYARENIWIPANTGVNSPVTIEVFNSTTNSTTNTTSNLIPTDSAFEDEWDFQFYTFTGFDQADSNQVEAQGETADYSHGRIVDFSPSTGGQTYDGNTLSMPNTGTKKVPTYYAYNYWDTIDLNLNPQYVSQFVPISSGSSTFGTASTETITTQDSTDTYVYKIGELKYGDGTGANTFTTIQVYTGSAWVFVDPAGKWAQGIYVWNVGTSTFDYSTLTYDQKIINLLSKNILYNQSESILTMSTTSALSETDKFYSGSSKLKFMNPLAKLNDTDGTEYILMRGKFNLSMDEWELNMVQINYEVPTTVTSGTKIVRSQG